MKRTALFLLLTLSLVSADPGMVQRSWAPIAAVSQVLTVRSLSADTFCDIVDVIGPESCRASCRFGGRANYLNILCFMDILFDFD